MSDDKDKYIGYIEMSLGIGDMVGPAIGGIIYDLAGYVGTFFSFGAMILLGMVYCIFKIPESLNDLASESSESSSSSSDEDSNDEEPLEDEK